MRNPGPGRGTSAAPNQVSELPQQSFGRASRTAAQLAPAPLPTAATVPDPAAPPRKSPRKKVMIRARIVYGDGAHSIDCTVCDISAGGAGIRLSIEHHLPKRIFLIVLRDSIAYEADVRWQARCNIGVEFLGSFPLDRQVPDDVAFLQPLADSGPRDPKGGLGLSRDVLWTSYKGFRISLVREGGGYAAFAQAIGSPVESAFSKGEKLTSEPQDCVDRALAAARGAIDCRKF